MTRLSEVEYLVELGKRVQFLESENKRLEELVKSLDEALKEMEQEANENNEDDIFGD